MPFLGKVPSQIVDSDVDIDGGTIDGATIGSITAGAGTFTNLSATGTITFPDDGISGDDINGGTISNVSISGTTASFSGDLTVDTNTLYVDSTNNRVGIGTTGLSKKFHVNSGTANAVSVFESTDATAYIQLKDPAGSGAVGTTGDGNGLRFWLGEAVTEAIRIDSIGRVFIGKLSDNDNTAGHTLHLSGLAVHTRDSSFAAIFNRTTNDGDIAQFKKDGAMVGKIASVSGGKIGFYGSGSTGAVIDSSGNLVIGGTSAGAKLDIQDATEARLRLNHTVSNTWDIANDSNLKFERGGIEHMRISSGGTLIHKTAAVFNEDGGNNDFRVESDTNTNALFVDAGNSRVGINNNTPSTPLDVREALSTVYTGTSASAQHIQIFNTATGATGLTSGIRFQTRALDQTGQGFFIGATALSGGYAPNFKFQKQVGATTYQELAALNAGEAVFNDPSNNYDFRVESDANSNALFVDASANTLTIGNEALIHNNVMVRRKDFHINGNTQVRIRVTVGNYNYGKLLVMARRSNSGNSVVYWEGFVNNNNNAGYSHPINVRSSGGTINYTFTDNGNGTYDWDFNSSGSSACGSVHFYEGCGDATITVTTWP